MSLAARAVDRLPAMRATIERRVFVTFRADPASVRPLVPDRYELRLTDGIAVGGVCLIRLGQLRPQPLPRWIGFASESAAHRISILGPDGEPAIWTPRRDSNSRLAATVGRALFPNTPGRATLTSGAADISVRCTDRNGASIASVDATPATELPADSLFGSVDDVCDYYRQARCGYSPGAGAHDTDSVIDLDIEGWKVEPLDVHRAASAVFDPLVESGAAVLDHAVLMRNLQSTWSFGN